jgi:hypothetical protein
MATWNGGLERKFRSPLRIGVMLEMISGVHLLKNRMTT